MSDNNEIIRKLNAIIARKTEIVDFGYMEFIYSKLPYIPFFHYLVAKDETCFMAINLELQLFTVDDTQRKALDFLYDLIMSHIKDATLPNSLKTRKAMKWTNIGASIARWSLPLLKKLLTTAKKTRFLRLK